MLKSLFVYTLFIFYIARLFVQYISIFNNMLHTFDTNVHLLTSLSLHFVSFIHSHFFNLSSNVHTRTVINLFIYQLANLFTSNSLIHSHLSILIIIYPKQPSPHLHTQISKTSSPSKSDVVTVVLHCKDYKRICLAMALEDANEFQEVFPVHCCCCLNSS